MTREKKEELKREIEKKVLILLSKKAIESALEKREVKVFPANEILEEISGEVIDDSSLKEKIMEEVEEYLKQKKGVFVTLRIDGRVRGCIGTFQKEEIWVQVQRYAVFSAFNDPRFPPLSKEELPKIKVEISILDDPAEVKDISEIKLGEDGILVEVKGKGGVLLPEVAEEFRVKTPEGFLSMLCRKLKLEPDCWRKAKIKKFKTKKIKEE